MKPLLCLIMIMVIHISYGQQTISGKIRDKISFKPLLNVKVQSSKGITYSNGQAEFSISVEEKDSIVFTLPSYKRVVIKIDSLAGRNSIFVEMMESSIPIEEVTVKIKKPEKDTFQFKMNLGIPKTPKYREIIMDRSKVTNAAMLKSSGSTSSLISVDLLAISRLLFKPKAKVNKEQVLEEDEYTIQYIDTKFKIETIEELTGLKGDAALIFQNTYRPSIVDLRSMTEYEIQIYIKKCYENYNQNSKSIK